jgi:hypothetical protein
MFQRFFLGFSLLLFATGTTCFGQSNEIVRPSSVAKKSLSNMFERHGKLSPNVGKAIKMGVCYKALFVSCTSPFCGPSGLCCNDQGIPPEGWLGCDQMCKC